MVALYILQKMLAVLILFRLKFIYAILSLLIFFFIFFLKEDRGDIIHYTKLVSNPYGLEPFYAYLIATISIFTENNRTVILVYQLLVLSLASSIILFFKENKILILSIIFTSIAVMLCVHNNLRQGTSSIFILIGIIAYIHGNKKIGILTTLASLGFHSSSILFISVLCILGFIYKNFITHLKKDSGVIVSYLISLLLSLICIYLLFSYIEISAYRNYLDLDLASNSSARVDHRTKVFILLFYWLSVEFFIKFRSVDHQIDLFRFLRQYFIFFTILLSLSQSWFEISNRVLYIFYILDLGLLCFLVDRKIYRLAVYMLLVYGFAFNIWTIIG
jgi:hypothetical protein